MTLVHNSEILFLYDAKLCNPNGDPDEENRPRMDYLTQTNLVSDVRLKRYIRNYLQAKGHTIYITKTEENEAMTATERIRQVLGLGPNDNLSTKDLPRILENFIDIRLFGATIPWKGSNKKESKSFSFTGPVQFSWGYSLHPVYLLDTCTITSHFASEKEKGQGTMGKDYRVKYSLIAFYGIISSHRSQKTQMNQRDLSLLEESLLLGISFSATRSKIGQIPRLYLRVEYTDSFFFLGDLRPYIDCHPKGNTSAESVFSLKDLHLSLQRLEEKLKELETKIHKIFYFCDKSLPLEESLRKLPRSEKLEISL